MVRPRGTPAYLFAVQIVTGILLAFYYEASPATAWDSVRRITDEAAFGWYIRGIHKWAATLMVVAVILHQMRVFFTGAYRKPREINWMVGMVHPAVHPGARVHGVQPRVRAAELLGATVGANIADSVPLVGGFMKKLMLAGDSYNQNTTSRFFVLHAAVLPVTLGLLVMIHIAIIRIQGVTEMKFDDEKEQETKYFNFFPDHMMTELILGLVLMVLLTTLATILPPTMGPRANPIETPEVIKPEWYFYVAFRWLKLFPGTVAVLSMGFVVFLMFLWPFVDAGIRKVRKGSELSVWIGIAAVAAILGLTIWEAAVAH